MATTASVAAMALVAGAIGVAAGPAVAASASDAWPGPVHHGVTSLQSCADVLVVGVRGSGQTADQNGGFGEQVGSFRDDLEAELGNDRTVRQVQIDYESLPVWAIPVVNVSEADGITNAYVDSIAGGIEALTAVVDDSLERCPNELLVVAGYSQGALVAHNVASVQARVERFAGVVLIADPGRSSLEHVPQIGDAPFGFGLTGWAGDVSALPLDDMAAVSLTICFESDLVCDTANENRVGPDFVNGYNTHTKTYQGSPELAQAARLVAQQVRLRPVPAKTHFDIPIGVPFDVQLTTKPIAAGETVTWRLDPGRDWAGSGLSLTPTGRLTGKYSSPSAVDVDVQVRTGTRPWRDVDLTLSPGAGEFCPAAEELVPLAADLRTVDDIWLSGDAPVSGALMAYAPPTTNRAAVDPSAAGPATTTTGVRESIVASGGNSHRRDPRIELAGHRLASPSGQIVNGSLLYANGSESVYRDLGADSIWAVRGIEPSWLRGELLTGVSYDDDGDRVVVWESFDGSRSGSARVLGTLLTGSSRGWYEWYRWPGASGCASDGTVMIREVDVTGAEPVRRNVAVLPGAGGSPVLAESDSSGSLALLTAVEHDRVVTAASVQLLTAGTSTMSMIGTIADDDLVGLSRDALTWLDPATAMGPSGRGAQMSVSGDAVSVHISRMDLWNGDIYDVYGDGIRSGTVYRFEKGEAGRKWPAKRLSSIITLPDATVFSGVDFATPTVGYPDGTTRASTLADSDRGRLQLSSDGTRLFAPPGKNGPLTDPWIGDDAVLRGYVYAYDTPQSPRTPVIALPVIGHRASVFGIQLSDDTLSWVDDRRDGGSEWTRAVGDDDHTIQLGTEVSGVAATERMESEAAPWHEGRWTIQQRESYSEDGEVWYGSEIVASRDGTEQWSEGIYNDTDAFRVHNDVVVIRGGCRAVDLHTGQELLSPVRKADLGMDSRCDWIDVDGDTLVWSQLVSDDPGDPWSEVHSEVYSAPLDDGGRARVVIPESEYLGHLSLEDDRLLVESVGADGQRLDILVADVTDPSHPGAALHHLASEVAFASAEHNWTSERPTAGSGGVTAGPGSRVELVEIERSGRTFAFTVTKDWAYDPASGMPYGAYTDSRIAIFDINGAAVGEIHPPAEQYDMYQTRFALNGSLLAWANGVGGVVVSRLQLPAAPPVVQTGTPTISGDARYGEPLTASPGEWGPGLYTYQYTWYRDGVVIPGAAASVYSPSAADIGARISVGVTATSVEGSVTRTSAATAPVRGLSLTAPTPAISGVPVVGGVLTAAAGTWTSGTTLQYAWFANGVAIAGAVASRYTVAAADEGKSITVQVTGAMTGYESSTRTSAASLRVLRAATPAITGTAATSTRLTAKPGTWSAGTTLRYQWYANGAAIPTATASSYVPTGSHVGKRITVKVTGVRAGYPTVSTVSAATAKVAKTGTVKITGKARVGTRLTVKKASWTAGSSYSYQWYANGKAIPGAKKSTLKISTSLKGKRVTVKVIVRKSGYATVTKTSTATSKVKR